MSERIPKPTDTSTDCEKCGASDHITDWHDIAGVSLASLHERVKRIELRSNPTVPNPFYAPTDTSTEHTDLCRYGRAPDPSAPTTCMCWCHNAPTPDQPQADELEAIFSDNTWFITDYPTEYAAIKRLIAQERTTAAREAQQATLQKFAASVLVHKAHLFNPQTAKEFQDYAQDWIDALTNQPKEDEAA